MERLRRLYGNKSQNAVSRSDPLQGSDKNLSIKHYTVLLAAAYFGLPGGFMLKSSDRE